MILLCEEFIEEATFVVFSDKRFLGFDYILPNILIVSNSFENKFRLKSEFSRLSLSFTYKSSTLSCRVAAVAARLVHNVNETKINCKK